MRRTQIDKQADLIADEAVTQGVVFVNAAGTFTGSLATQNVNMIGSPGCGYNVITVGAADSTHLEKSFMNPSSPHGPVNIIVGPRIKPEITASGMQMVVLNTDGVYQNAGGTSFAAPLVSGAAALVREARIDYTPLQVKDTLLLGADWKGPETIVVKNGQPQKRPIDYTTDQYEADWLSGSTQKANAEHLNTWGILVY